MGYLNDWIEYAAKFIEITAVVIMLGFITVGTIKWLFLSGKQIGKGYEKYRVQLGKALLVSIELLVAADIIRTVILESSIYNIAALGLLVLVRTFLGWTLTVEVEGRWPWQKKQESHQDVTEGMGTKPYPNITSAIGSTGDKTERRK